MLLKLLSPVSVLTGVLSAAVALAVLWPVDRYGAPLALMAFAIGSGLMELFRRLRTPPGQAPDSLRRRDS
jgi:hypothetical protein